MLTPAPFNDEHDPVAPECRATVGAIQLLLDGETTDALDADPHAGVCATCRERVRAARVLLSVLVMPGEPARVPVGFAENVLSALAEDGKTETRPLSLRRRVLKVAGWAALAAAVLVAGFLVAPRSGQQKNDAFTAVVPPAPPEAVPALREKVPMPAPVPDPRPIRIGDEVTKAGQAFRDTPKPLTDSVAAAPKLFDAFATAFRKPVEPVAPMGEQLEPARRSLAELPDAARSGLEPVTGTAQKAFARLLRDVASVKPKS